ncbi:MAG: hypothetical protein EZS28_027660, partial [Streblomastix strix]
MVNINREMRQRIEINNNIPGMDMESERNEYKNVGREKVKDDIGIKGLVQHNIQEQKREDKITRSADRQTELSQTPDKGSVLYLIELDKTKTQALKMKSWNEIMIVNKVVIRELKWWIRRIGDNQPESFINRSITCMLTTDASPQGQGATLIYQNQIKLIQHNCWSEKEAEMTSNAKEIKAIYFELLRFEQVFKKMQDQAILIRSDITTAVYDFGKWKAKESLIERIKQVFFLVKRLKLQITTIHIPGKLNSTTDSLSRLCRSGDYSLKEVIFQMISKTWNYIPEMDLFATQNNK